MQKGGNVKNVKMFCALLASNDERTLHMLAHPQWRQFKNCFKSAHLLSLSLSLSHSVSLSVISKPVQGLSGRTHLAVVRQSAAINTLTFDMFRCRKCQLQQLTRLSGCTHKVATGHAPNTCPICRGTLCTAHMCIHQLALTSLNSPI